MTPDEPGRAGGHRCPDCGEPSQYQTFSGGREWWCPNCKSNGDYPDDEGPRRVQMLRNGQYDELRQEMHDHLDAVQVQAVCVHDDGHEHPSDGSLPCSEPTS